jgi:hypothetical protein
MQEFAAGHGTALVVFGFVLLLVGLILSPVFLFIVQWRRVRQAEIDASLQKAELDMSLKQDLANRGLSADDILKVLQIPAMPATASPSWLGAAITGLFKGPRPSKANAESHEESRHPWAGIGVWARCGKFRSRRPGCHGL